jgi:hypothetical protein
METWKNILKTVLIHGPDLNTSLSSISYHERSIKLNIEKYNTVITGLPEKWYNDVEKLVRFDVRIEKNTGEIRYHVEVEKNAFDFRIRDYTRVVSVRKPTDEECTELYTYFKDSFNKFCLEEYDNLYDSILEKISNRSVLQINLLELRDTMLKESDIYMLPDYPISEEQREKIIKYRQELRDITDQEAWPDDLENINIPVAPIEQSDQVDLLNQHMFQNSVHLFSNGTIADLAENIFNSQSENIIKNYMSVALKLNVLATLYNLKIPLFLEQNHTNFVQIEEENKNYFKSVLDNYSMGNEVIFESTDQSFTSYEDAVSQIDSKIQVINENIKNYNLDFTINDIIQDLLSRRKEEILVDQEVEQIIDDL